MAASYAALFSWWLVHLLLITALLAGGDAALMPATSVGVGGARSDAGPTGKPRERAILLTLFNVTQQGDGWLPGCKVGWHPPTANHCDGWNGIDCDDEGYVRKISLGGCGLANTFPVPSIFTFERLEWVQVSEHPQGGKMAENPARSMSDVRLYLVRCFLCCSCQRPTTRTIPRRRLG